MKTKTILVILDGLSEEKITELNNMAPLEYAYTPTIDKIEKEGCHREMVFYPSGRQPDSLSCIPTILGVDKGKIPYGRAYIEAVAAGINVEENEAVLRCNLISIKENRLESFNGKGLSKKEMDEVSDLVVTLAGSKFYHLNDYRNILVLEKNEELLSLKSVPPHENVGINTDKLFRGLKNIKILSKFIENNHFFIRGMHYMFYPWGLSEKINLPSFYTIHKKTCSLVCQAEIVKGIGKLMNIPVAILKNATGDTDTDLNEKADAVLKETLTHDVVVAHINGIDEVSHRKDLYGKVEFIEKIDRDFLSKIYKNISCTKLIIVSDHQTSCITGKHEKGFVDYITNVREDENVKGNNGAGNYI